jgi:hypothetical protein
VTYKTERPHVVPGISVKTDPKPRDQC